MATESTRVVSATHRWSRLSLPFLGCGVLLVPRIAPTPGPPADAELQAAVSCVITAWNAYDAEAARRCYHESAAALWSGERKPIDWRFERRLRAFDAAARSGFRFEILRTRGSIVEFSLHETNQLLEALGLPSVTARWRYTIRGGRIVEEQLLEGDGAFGAALRELAKWARERRPEKWASVTDAERNIRFDGDTAPRLIDLAREWSRTRGSRRP
jgi:hypothetical protein